jgi:DNA processing protein
VSPARPPEGATPPMDDDELDAWLSLAHRPGLTRVAVRRLLAAFGSPQRVLAATPAALRSVVGGRIDDDVLAAPDADHGLRVDAVRAWLAAGRERRIIALGDADYPAALLQAADPPLLLYAEGPQDALRAPALAIVGSRQATPQGRLNAHAFARDMARRGWAIVSGLASGIDAAAHEGALEGGGLTIAVVGTGLDQVYPAANRALAQRIAERGVVLSEFALGTPPLSSNFPQRNRIIATLARGTLVVEATLQSGSLITARLAVEAGRDVFAIPGSIHQPQSRGCHALLRQGAKLVETSADLLDELTPRAAPVAQAAPASDEPADAAADDVVLRALGHDPTTLDALMARCGWPAAELSAHLLELELAGQVARLPGGLFQRIVCT